MDGKNVDTEHQYSNCYLITSFVIILHERKDKEGHSAGWLAGYSGQRTLKPCLPAGPEKSLVIGEKCNKTKVYSIKPTTSPFTNFS